jgi:uncharacterized membrane protein YuzA (DUF378 family)
MSSFLRQKLHALAILLLVIGGVNAGLLALTGTDPVRALFGTKSLVTNGIFLSVGLAALSIAFFRDSYLPFLGSSVVPCDVLQAHTPEGADAEVRVVVAPGAKVLYWASEPANEELAHVQDWKQAYLGFRNAGVAVADADGRAALRVRKPQGYTVPMKGELAPHVHYRVCEGSHHLGRVETVRLDGTEQFANPVSREESPEPVDSPSEFLYVNPATALAEINEVAKKTGARSLMPQEGGVDEGAAIAGADLGAAFAPASAPLYTAIQYEGSH